MLEIIKENAQILTISKAVIIIVIGILVGYILKHSLRKTLDRLLLKKLFRKDLGTYETSTFIMNIFTEIIQWSIIIIFLNYSLNLLNYNILTRLFGYITKEIPTIIIFLTIISIGIIISKISSGWIKSKKLESKEEIATIIEIIIVAAFILSAIEYIGIKATAINELFKAILYLVIALIILLIIKPGLIKKAV